MKITEVEINGEITVCIDDENGNLTWMQKSAYDELKANEAKTE
jgi:hypothetical protein